MTGQTGSGQTRLTLGGSTRRCPRDWNGVPAERFASGSALQAHHALSATRPSSEKQSVPRSCSSVPPARSSTSVQHRDARIRIQIPLVKKRKSLQWVSRCPRAGRFQGAMFHAAADQRITRSARSSRACGILTPMALAVLRLIANSKVVGCSTGKFATCPPCIRPIT